tara:strand:- start:1301 stop:2095 length:795 start_codon:yes stop_codon:yes gene_type:complete
MQSFNNKLVKTINQKKSWLCVGLDISPENLGESSLNLLKDHCKKVIDCTRDIAVAYKPNFAFFERWGSKGYQWLEEVVDYIGDSAITIADAKRGDIGSTAEQYAISIFDHLKFDAVTINPFLGSDSIIPFSKYEDKGVFILCRTSNPSGNEFQLLNSPTIPLFENIASWANGLNINQNIGLVIGATRINELKSIRKISPKLPLLIPGIGAQGGNLKSSAIIGNSTGPAIINVSRGISFSGKMSDKDIRDSALNYNNQIRNFINA